MKPRPHFSAYKPPAIDSMRAKANAALFLVGARKLEHVSAAELADWYRLKPETAQFMLEREKERRNG